MSLHAVNDNATTSAAATVVRDTLSSLWTSTPPPRAAAVEFAAVGAALSHDDDAALLRVGIVASLAVTAVTYWGMGGLLHWWFYVHRRADADGWKLQPRRWLSGELTAHAFALGSFNAALGGVVGGVFTWLVLRGSTAHTLYFALDEWPLLWLPASLLVCVALIDAGLYYGHRFDHTPFMYRHVHKVHHRYLAPIVFTATAMHPVELLIFQSAIIVPAFVLPMHWAVYVVAVLYTYFIGMLDHCGIEFTCGGWLPFHDGNRFHDEHHAYFHCNFGHHTHLWDRLHGTERVKSRVYDEHTFGGFGRAAAATATATAGGGGSDNDNDNDATIAPIASMTAKRKAKAR